MTLFLTLAWQFLKGHWRWAVWVASLLGALLAGYVKGRRVYPDSCPVPASHEEVRKEDELHKVQRADESTTKTSVATTIYRRRVTKATPTTPTIIETEKVVQGRIVDHKTDVKLVDDLKLTTQTEVKDTAKSVDLRPRWRVGAGVGYQFAKESGLVYGGEVDYRIIGPLMVGARIYKVPNGVSAIGVLSLSL